MTGTFYCRCETSIWIRLGNFAQMSDLRMKKMRRIDCFITAALLGLLVFVSSPTWAEEYALKIAGVAVTSDNCNKLNTIAGVSGELKYNPTGKLLTVKNVKITSPDGKIAIENTGIIDLTIQVEGKNELTSKNADGLSIGVSATLKGQGSLKVTTEGNNSGVYIRTGATLTVEKTTLTVEGENGIFGQDRIHGRLTIRNATVDATGRQKAIADLAALNIQGCGIEGGYWNSSSHAVMDGNQAAKNVHIAPFYGFYIAGKLVNDKNVDKLNSITGVSGELKYNPTKKLLTLKDVKITPPDGRIAIENVGITDLTIQVEGKNELTTKNADALSFGVSTTLTGKGSLTAKAVGNNAAVYVRIDATLTVENTTLIAEGRNGIFGQNGSSGTLTIRTATVDATGKEGFAITDLVALNLEGSKISVPKGGYWNSSQRAVTDGSGKAKKVHIDPTYGFCIAGEDITAENCNQLNTIAGVSGELKYNPTSNTLTLKDVKITPPDGKIAIETTSTTGLKIEVEGKNELTTKDADALSFGASATLTGKGSLKATANGNNSGVYIRTGATLTVENITFTAEGRNGIFGQDGSHGTLTIHNATVDATGKGGYAIADLAALNLEVSKISVPKGGYWNSSQHAVMDGNGKAKKVHIDPFYGFYIAGEAVTADNCNKLNTIAGVSGELKYDPTSNTLTLKEAKITPADGQIAIRNTSATNLTIEVVGKNVCTVNKEDCFRLDCATSIKGQGSLKLASDRSAIWVYNSILTLNDITLYTEGDRGLAGNDGVQGELIVNQATVSAKGKEYAIGNLKAFTLNGSKIVIPNAGQWNNSKHAVMDGSEKAKWVKIVKSDVVFTMYDLLIAGEQLTSDNYNKLGDIAGVSGELEYDPTSNILTLKDVKIKPSDGKIAIHNMGISNLKIKVSGKNELTVNKEDCLRLDDATFIEGNGTLILKSDRAAIRIAGNATLNLTDLTLHTEGNWGVTGSNGTQGSLIINQATLDAKGKEYAMGDFKTFTQNGTKIVVPNAGQWNDAQHAVLDGSEKAKWVKIVKSDVVFAMYDLSIAGEQLTSENCNKLGDLYGVTLSAGSELKYDPTKKLLTLKDVKITPSDGKIAIETTSTTGLTIEVEGQNELTTTNADALSFGASATLTGSGSLTAKAVGNNSGVYVRTGATLTIENTTLIAEGRNGIFGQDGYNGTLTIRNAVVDATGREGYAIADLAALNLEGCKISVPKGGYWNSSQHAVMDGSGKTKKVRIDPFYGFYIAGEAVTSDNYNKLGDIDGVSGELKYDPTKKLLTLKDVKITPPDGKIAIENTSTTGFTIQVEGQNELTTKDADGLSFGASATLTGEGALKVTANGNNSGVYVRTGATLTVENITLTAEGKNGIFGQNGSHGTLTIRNATVDATGKEGFAIADLAALNLQECEIVVPRGGKWDDQQHAVTDGAAKAKKVEVRKTIFFSLAPTVLAEVPAAGGTQSVTLTSNKAWSLRLTGEDISWVIPSTPNGTGSQEVTFTVKENQKPSPRSLTVTFTQTGTGRELTIEIKQLAKFTPLKHLYIKPDKLPIKVGGKAKLTLTFDPTDATNKEVVWAVTEGDASLSVDQEGNITATQVAGTAKVTATSKENPTIVATCEVKVSIEDVPVESVEVVPSSLEISETESAKLGVKITPMTATNQEVTWSIKSGSENITLTGNEVKGVRAGQAEVEASVGGQKAVCTITVKAKVPVTSVKITPETVTLAVQKTQQLEAVIDPKDATHKTVTWTLTSGEGVVTLSETGLVTALKEGTATVTATVDGISATCTVTVTIPVKSVKITPETVTLSVQKTQQLEAVIAPKNATHKTVTWTLTSGEGVVTLSETGLVTALKGGTATVKATVDGISATRTITVTIPVTSVKIEPETVTLAVQKTQQLEAVIDPKDATHKTVTWTLTSGEGVVTLSETGLVTALKEGTATVTATVDGISATCTITVTIPGAVEDALLATVSVTPNPFTTQLRILNPNGASLTYELLSITGIVLRKGMLLDTETVVDTTHLPAGLYFVRLTGRNGEKRGIKVLLDK